MDGCPDIDVLIELSRSGRAPEAALLEHTSACDQCRSDLAMLGEIRTALKPDRAVPEALVARVMAGLPDPPPEPAPAVGRPGSSPWDMGISFALGTATVAAALILGSPEGGAGTMLDLTMFSAAMGLVVSLVEPKVLRVSGALHGAHGA